MKLKCSTCDEKITEFKHPHVVVYSYILTTGGAMTVHNLVYHIECYESIAGYINVPSKDSMGMNR